MANKETILIYKEYDLDDLLSSLLYLNIKNVISRTQLKTIEELCKLELPAFVELKQRTPKGIINLWINGVEKYRVNTRSKVFYIYL
jgi:hypothetical protein